MPLPEPPSPKPVETLLRELAYAVSHDLGASSRAITGFSELLTHRYAPELDDDGRKYLRLLTQAAANLQAQLDGLLAYSRVESRGGPLCPTNVADVWTEITQAAAAQLQQAGATVETGELPMVLADARQLAELLAQLLDNALKFRREVPIVVRFTASRPIVLDCSRTGWEFRLTDNGRGIAPQHLTRVFQLFQRCHADVPGVGAGLAVAQRIVQRHGGVIWAESTVGVGTSVCFTWPAFDGR